MKLNPNITYFAKCNFRHRRDLIGIYQEDRAYHSYFLGKTGSGKSNVLLSQIFQDIKHGRGLCVVDIHGDLLHKILEHLPKHRLKDVVHLDLTNAELSSAYNPLRRVSYEKRPLVVGSILESLQKLWSSSWGDRIENLLRHILLSLVDQPFSVNLRDIIRILQDETFRNKCILNVVNPDIKSFWTKEFLNYSKRELTPVISKISAFLAYPSIKRILVDTKESVSLREVMDKRQILLVNISKGSAGVDELYVFASILISSITSAAFSRVDTPENHRIPFHLYLDEFQNYSSSIATMLSELRKFKICINLANQYLGQLSESVKKSVLGNVGTIVCFRIGAVDANYMLLEFFKEYQPIFTIGDYVNLPNYHVVIKLMIKGKPSRPFTGTTLHYKHFI